MRLTISVLFVAVFALSSCGTSSNDYSKGLPENAIDEFIDAAHGGDLDKVKALIDAGIDVNGQDEHHMTALGWATRRYRAEVVKTLLAAGADPNTKRRKDITVLMDAAFYSNEEILKLLIDAGAELNAQSESGGGAIKSAVDKGRLNMVQALIAAGADVDIKNEAGYTPLYKALSERYEEIALAARQPRHSDHSSYPFRPF